MKVTLLAFLLLLFPVSPGCAREPTVISEPGKMGTVWLSDGSSFQTTLFGLRYLGELKAKQKKPFLILAGRGCDECDANTSIYIHSPSDGPMKGESDQPRYFFPGVLKHYESGEIVQKTRTFVGACIPGGEEAVVWYVNWRDEQGKWLSGYEVARISRDAVETNNLERPEEKLDATLRLTKEGICKEIVGIDGYTEP
jgi:hypothetical protein